MSLYLSARHYWSQVDYSSYSALNNDGSLSRTAWSGNSNLNFNSFNIYTGFTWQFKPGSEMSVVYQNSIFSRGSQLVADYSTNLNRVLAAPQSNSLSVKVVYYLDYLVLRKRFSR
jgi:hypothetical protein